MSTLKDYLREVRVAAAEHLDASHRADEGSVAAQALPREEALATIALVTIRLLEQQLSQHHETSAEGQTELQAHLKACRRALKAHAVSSSSASSASAGKRSRSATTAAASASATAPASTAESGVDLGQYTTTDAFGSNSEKRLKFARLMGGAKASGATSAERGASSASQAPQPPPHTHNTHAKNSAEVRRMNESLESQFEAAMSHKGKKGLGA